MSETKTQLREQAKALKIKGWHNMKEETLRKRIEEATVGQPKKSSSKPSPKPSPKPVPKPVPKPSTSLQTRRTVEELHSLIKIHQQSIDTTTNTLNDEVASLAELIEELRTESAGASAEKRADDEKDNANWWIQQLKDSEHKDTLIAGWMLPEQPMTTWLRTNAKSLKEAGWKKFFHDKIYEIGHSRSAARIESADLVAFFQFGDPDFLTGKAWGPRGL